MFTLKEHTERLFKSAKEIGIHLQGTVSDMEEKLQQLVAHNQLTDGGVYIQVTRGVALVNINIVILLLLKSRHIRSR